MSFDPAKWPADCPHTDAEPASGEVFRIVRSNPPSPADFITPHEAGTLKSRDNCLRRALSVYRNKNDAETTMRMFPQLGRLIARGVLHPSNGVLKATPTRGNSHHTWWPCDDTDRVGSFHVVP